MKKDFENPREDARYLVDIVEGREVWDHVDAEMYDQVVHGTNLRCGDDLCRARVRHRSYRYEDSPVQTSHGGSFERHAHFYSIDRDEHRANCSWLAPAYNRNNSVTLRQAYAEKLPIILNINFPVGNPLMNSFGSVVGGDGIRSRYNNFRRDYKHATIAIHTLQEFFRAVAKLQAHGDDTVRRAQVAHCQDIRRLNNVMIGNDPALFKNLEEAMEKESEREVYDKTITGFARLIRWKPTPRELSEATRPHEINGLWVELQHRGRASLGILNTLVVPDDGMKRDILRYSEQDIFATPSIQTQDIRRARLDFSAGRIGYIHIKWRVDSKAQFQPSPHAFEVATPYDQMNLDLAG